MKEEEILDQIISKTDDVVNSHIKPFTNKYKTLQDFIQDDSIDAKSKILQLHEINYIILSSQYLLLQRCNQDIPDDLKMYIQKIQEQQQQINELQLQ